MHSPKFLGVCVELKNVYHEAATTYIHYATLRLKMPYYLAAAVYKLSANVDVEVLKPTKYEYRIGEWPVSGQPRSCEAFRLRSTTHAVFGPLWVHREWGPQLPKEQLWIANAFFTVWDAVCGTTKREMAKLRAEGGYTEYCDVCCTVLHTTVCFYCLMRNTSAFVAGGCIAELYYAATYAATCKEAAPAVQMGDIDIYVLDNTGIQLWLTVLCDRFKFSVSRLRGSYNDDDEPLLGEILPDFHRCVWTLLSPGGFVVQLIRYGKFCVRSSTFPAKRCAHVRAYSCGCKNDSVVRCRAAAEGYSCPMVLYMAVHFSFSYSMIGFDGINVFSPLNREDQESSYSARRIFEVYDDYKKCNKVDCCSDVVLRGNFRLPDAFEIVDKREVCDTTDPGTGVFQKTEGIVWRRVKIDTRRSTWLLTTCATALHFVSQEFDSHVALGSCVCGTCSKCTHRNKYLKRGCRIEGKIIRQNCF